MPGIAGIIAPSPAPEHAALARRMVATLRHRADDLIGSLDEASLGLSAGWVAHPGSFAARLCAAPPAGGPRVLWAGECFATGGPGSDDPALLYARHGEDFARHLNGLFSGLVIDTARGCALLVNDRFGSERLYVHRRDGVTYFASEAKALLAVLPQLRAFDEDGVADFLTFGSTLQGRTLFRGLTLQPGASIWTFRRGAELAHARYFLPAQWEASEPLDEAGFEAALSETFARVMPAYGDGALPLGVSLTGGLDTRMIMSCLPETSPRPACYTYAAQHGETLDVSIGRRVAQARGLSHQPLRLPTNFLQDFGRHVDRAVHVTDGCAGALVAHEIPFSEQAHDIAPVRMTGNFGSEVLRSMSTFKPLGLADGLVDASWQPALQRAAARVAGDVHPVTHAAFEEIPWHLSGSLQAGRSQLVVRTPFLDNEIVALSYRAPAASRHSASPSLRLIHDHAPALASIPTDRGLAWQRGGWAALPRRLYCGVTFKLDYWHKEGLPSRLSWSEPLFSALEATGVLGLHKFLPYRRWFRRELAPQLREIVNDSRARQMPFWSRRFLDGVVEDHVQGRANRLRELHAILTLEAVDRTLLSDRSAPVDPPLNTLEAPCPTP